MQLFFIVHVPIQPQKNDEHGLWQSRTGRHGATGLDFGAMMDEIDDQEELEKESENVKELLGQVKKTASDLETSFETMVIEAFGMDETTASIQETAVKIGWTLNLINAQLTTLKDAKVTSQLDDKSVLEVKGLHQEVLAEQKLGLEKYKLELKEAFAQYKRELKEIVHGHGVWLSDKAWVWAILIVYIVIAFFFLLGFIVARNRYL